ncbi:MAG: hypothetical protein VB143_08465 [Burkholderia sp.]
MISGNADGLRAGEFSHAVEHAHSNGCTGSDCLDTVLQLRRPL